MAHFGGRRRPLWVVILPLAAAGARRHQPAIKTGLAL
jgi:hypothetical protein